MLLQKIKYCVIILLCLASLTEVEAQDTTKLTNDTVYHRLCRQDQFDGIDSIIFTPIDISLYNFQKYEPLTSCSFLGNSGKPYKSLLFETHHNVGFNLDENAYRNYMPTFNDVNYYNVSSPYSDLYYVMGSTKEQILKVVHSQNVNKQLNFALNINIINSVGAYRRQKTDISNFIFTSNYKSKNNRYALIGNIRANKWFNYENGGLLNISDFTTQLLDRADQFDIKLDNAQNKIKESGVFIKQYINFNKKNFNDSIIAEGNNTYNTRLSHAFYYNRNSIMYVDEFPSLVYYPKIYFDSITTGDSTFVHFLSNELTLTQIFFRGKDNLPILYAEAGLENQYIDHRQFITLFIDSLIPFKQKSYFINQFIAKAALYINPKPTFKTRFGAYMIFEGYNKGDAGINATAKISFNKVHNITLKASMDNFQPAFHYNHYISNHYIWENNFDKINYIRLSASHNIKGFNTELQAHQLFNFVNYDYYANPKQYNKSVQVVSLTFSKLIHFGEFNLDNFIHIQQSTNSNIIPLPLIVNSHSFYWGTHMFKKALYAQMGTDIYFNSSFYGLDYMPATRQFFIQKHTLTGNYPLLDVFIKLRIKRANIFVKLTHLNQGLLEYDFYSVPSYPLQGRAFKLGISWKFYD